MYNIYIKNAKFEGLLATKEKEITMDTSRRPENMQRITTKELADKFIAEQVAEIQKTVGDKKVLLALSGGVDSSVVAALLIKAIGKQLVSVHVNHGLMRKGESEQVIEVFEKQLQANLVYIDATDRYLEKLAGVSDPEQKRKIIGGEFIRIFEEEARKLSGIEFLAQGTIYPDILESIKQAEGKKAVKSHHNVGGLPEDMQFALLEPIKLLFKDEVQVIRRAVAHQFHAIPVQDIAAGGLDTGDGGVGGGVIGVTVGFHDLQLVQLEAEQHQDHGENAQQNPGSAFTYSFHVSPPISPILLTRG